MSGAEERRLKSYAIVDAPPHLGLRSAGVEQLPGALLGPGFAKRLAARLPPPPYESRNDPETWMLNPPACATIRSSCCPWSRVQPCAEDSLEAEGGDAPISRRHELDPEESSEEPPPQS